MSKITGSIRSIPTTGIVRRQIGQSLRERIFDLRLDIMPTLRTLSSLATGPYGRKRVYRDMYGSVVRFQGQQGGTLVGTLYRPRGTGPHPAILLLHGSTPAGRKLGMYRVMGRELAARGYLVLCIDQRGYGDSDDPQRVDRPEDFDYAQDASLAMRYLCSLEGVNRERAYVVGHSFGGDVAITAGTFDPLMRKIVAIGPGRRYYERAAAELDYFRRRAKRYMRLDQPIPADVFLQTYAAQPLENHLEYFSQATHKPLMLIDGELESKADRQFLQEMVEGLADPKTYMTLPGADHYANIANIGTFVVYDHLIVEQLISTIHEWLSRP